MTKPATVLGDPVDKAEVVLKGRKAHPTKKIFYGGKHLYTHYVSSRATNWLMIIDHKCWKDRNFNKFKDHFMISNLSYGDNALILLVCRLVRLTGINIPISCIFRYRYVLNRISMIRAIKECTDILYMWVSQAYTYVKFSTFKHLGRAFLMPWVRLLTSSSVWPSSGGTAAASLVVALSRRC